MPILTKNETPTKGQKAEFQLDKAALAALSSVSSDIYFSDMTNWNQVELVYVSPVGRQRKVVKFDATQATPIGVFFASLKAKNDFQIQYIMINDFDGGEFKISRSELTVAEFDIEMGETPVSTEVRPTSVVNFYGLNVVGNLADGSTSSDPLNYASAGAHAEAKLDLGQTKTINKVSISLGALTPTSDGMEWLPAQISIYKGQYGSTFIKSFTIPFYDRAYFTANVLKDFVLDAPETERYFVIHFDGWADQSQGTSVKITEITTFE
jgi:hypothetical protein